MASSSTTKPRDVFVILGGLVLVTACLYWARQVLIPVALAVLLAFVLTPAVSALQRRGLGRLPSVILVVLLTLLLLGGVGYVISHQINALIANMPSYQGQLFEKLDSLLGVGEGDAPEKLKEMFQDVKQVGWSHLGEAAGQTAEGLADAFLVLVLVVFMLIKRENLRNRLVRLIGRGRLIATTQAFDEGAQRVSRYLWMLLCINTLFGAVLAIGLFALGWLMGQHVLWRYALLWGFVALILRFVPYLGTWLAAALLTAFSIATLPGWGLPLLVFAFFVVLELLTANVVEPLLFGHSTGVSPLALLLAAAFWIWLWGPVGLILSTPLTVVLVVLGKYVPELKFFEVLLGDEPVLSADVTFYQRLVARDLDEASDLVECYLREHSPEQVYQEVFLPALLLAKKDRERGELEAENYESLLQGIRETEEDLSAALAEHVKPAEGAAKAVALGCPGCDEADELALKMLGELVRLSGHSLDILSTDRLSAEMVEKIQQVKPTVVCIGSLPPGGLSQARYLCKRIRQEAPDIKILVGRWGEKEHTERMEARLHDAGADGVATTLHDSCAQIVPLLQVAANSQPDSEAKPSELVTTR